MTKRPDLRVIGLTGGIATGKSSIARYLEELGCTVIDADQLAREAVQAGSPALAQIVGLFGPEVLTPQGTLDRKHLGLVVFADPLKRRQLERIVHPEVRRLAQERLQAAAEQGQRTVFYMAPLLIEAGATEVVDEIWVVTVAPEIQLERLMHRDGLTRLEAQRIIDAQMPLHEKAAYGRIVIDNSGTPEESRRLVADIWKKDGET